MNSTYLSLLEAAKNLKQPKWKRTRVILTQEKNKSQSINNLAIDAFKLLDTRNNVSLKHVKTIIEPPKLCEKTVDEICKEFSLSKSPLVFKRNSRPIFESSLISLRGKTSSNRFSMTITNLIKRSIPILQNNARKTGNDKSLANRRRIGHYRNTFVSTFKKSNSLNRKAGKIKLATVKVLIPRKKEFSQSFTTTERITKETTLPNTQNTATLLNEEELQVIDNYLRPITHGRIIIKRRVNDNVRFDRKFTS